MNNNKKRGVCPIMLQQSRRTVAIIVTHCNAYHKMTLLQYVKATPGQTKEVVLANLSNNKCRLENKTIPGLLNTKHQGITLSSSSEIDMNSVCILGWIPEPLYSGTTASQDNLVVVLPSFVLCSLLSPCWSPPCCLAVAVLIYLALVLWLLYCPLRCYPCS